MGPITWGIPGKSRRHAFGIWRATSPLLRAFVFVGRLVPMSPVSLSPSTMLRPLRCLALSLLMLACTAPARADVADVMRRIQADGQARVVVRMKADTGAATWSARDTAGRQRAAVAAALENTRPALRGARIRAFKSFRTLPLLATTVDREQLMSLVASPEVDEVFLVRRERKMADVAVPALESAQIFNAQSSIDIASAWAKGYDGSGYAVAVIDGGFNFNHPMLAGKNVGDACFASDDATTKSNCPTGAVSQIGVGAASNCPQLSDRCNHGTHVASVAAGNDGTNFGVARGAKIVPVDVFYSISDPTDCAPALTCEVTDSVAVLDALDYINERAAALNIAAVNISIGGDLHDGYCDEDVRRGVIDMLRQKGIAVAIAAGNGGATGRVAVPACVSSAIAVGATNDGTSVANFSNFAHTVDVMAPGVGVYGASGGGIGLVTSNGTSSAAPHVAGAWTVLRQAVPAGTFVDLENALKQTGVPVTRFSSGFSVPKIQVMAAINRLQGKDRRILNSLVSGNAPLIGQSYLRLFNTGVSAGTVTVTLRDATTGAVAGTWTSPQIPSQASPQFSFESIERDAGTPQAAGRIYYNLDVTSTFTGYMQHVLWARTGGVFANLSGCAAGASDGQVVSNVHASNFTSYESRLRMVNTGSAAAPAVLRLYDSLTGVELATWTSPDIAPGATFEMQSSQLEDQIPALKARVDAGLLQYNVRLGNLAGYLQHVVENSQVGALVDMSAKCELGFAAAR